MRIHRLAAIVALLTAGACADLKDVLTLSSSLQARYGVPANVNIANGSHLTITFQNAPESVLKADSAGRADFAHDVASFAKAHYPHAAELEDVTVAFATVTKTGLITVTRTDAPYSFAARDLP